MTFISEQLSEDTKKLKKPCKDCPYSRTVIPGALGGSDPEVYIGQGQGSFWLPCHKTCDFSDPNWKTDYQSTQQCAGAAMYRANIGRDKTLSPQLLRLPPSELAFGSPEELYAHHKGISIEGAKLHLRANPPDRLMAIEYYKAHNL